MFFAFPVPPAFLIGHPCIYSNSVDYLTFLLGGHGQIQDRKERRLQVIHQWCYVVAVCSQMECIIPFTLTTVSRLHDCMLKEVMDIFYPPISLRIVGIAIYVFNA